MSNEEKCIKPILQGLKPTEKDKLIELLDLVPQEGLCEFCKNNAYNPNECKSTSIEDCAERVRDILKEAE